MTRPSGARRVPDLVLERYRLGELPEAEAGALERRLQEDVALRERLEALERSDEEIRGRYPAAWLAEQIRSRRPATGAGRSSVARSPRWWLPVAVAAAASLLLVLAPQLVSPPSSPSPARRPTALDSGDRTKGLEPSLQLYRRTPEGSEELADGSVARAGDLIRVAYRAAGSGFGVILSIDGRGTVSVHLPLSGDRAAQLRSGEAVLLSHAYELDDAPRFERFYLVTGARPFSVGPVVSAARRVATSRDSVRLPLPSSLRQNTFLLRKGDRP